MDIELNLTTESVEQASPAEPVCVEPHYTVRQVFEHLKENRAGNILVCRDGVLIGIFTERDALRIMARAVEPGLQEQGLQGEPGYDPAAVWDAPIETAMTRDPVTLGPQSPVAAAVQKMASGGYRRLPIVDSQGRPVGVVQAAGIVHYLVEHFPKTVYNQPPVPHPVMQEREGS
ncbi:MAG: CBS domain-containing protein [Pirellulales bacterium]